MEEQTINPEVEVENTDSVVVRSKEEIEEAILQGDPQTVNDYLSGKIVVGEPNTEEATITVDEESQETEEIYDEEKRQELIKEITAVEEPHDVDNTPQANPTTPVVDQELQKKLDEQARAIEELKSKLESKDSGVQTPVAPLKLDDEDDDDLVYASPVSKNNRLMLQELKQKIDDSTGTLQEELMEKLRRLELAEEERQKEKELEEAKRAQEELKKKMFSEITELQSEVETFRTSKNIDEIYSEYTEFRKRLSEFIGSSNEAQLNKAIRSALGGNSENDIAFKKTLTSARIDIPSDGETYLKLADVVDLKNGRRYNHQTGNYEVIKDEYGKVVNQRSLKDAYKLSTFSDKLSAAEANAAKDIQRKLLAKQNGAVTIPNGKLADPAQQQLISTEEATAILSMSSAQLSSNPALKKKYEQIVQQYSR